MDINVVKTALELIAVSNIALQTQILENLEYGSVVISSAGTGSLSSQIQ